MTNNHLLFTAAVFALSLSSSAYAVDADPTEKVKNRIETLFIWRVADKLSLSPTQENSFSKIYRDASRERQEYAQQMDKILDQMEEVKKDAEYDKLFKDYSALLRKYNDCQVHELDALKKIFDSKKLSQYVLVKRDMTKRFKDVVSAGGAGQSPKPASVPLKDPEVIQEK
jgi:hypothetical protein